MAPAEGTKAAVSRIEELRRVLAATPDAIARARLRVELSGLLRARSDPFAALSELRRAAHEAPQLPGVRLALLSAAAELAPGERAMLLAEHARADKGPVAIWAHAAAAARAENGAVEEATRAFLEIAVDGRVPAHRRRAAARRALALADASPRQQVAALRAQAALAGGRNRLALLRRAATLAERAGDAPALLAVAGDWLVAGGPADGAVAWLGRARGAGATPVALAALESEIARRAPAPPPAPAVVTAAAPLRRSGPPPSPLALLAEAALAARAGRPRTARRRAEQALRLDQTAVDLAPAVDAVVVALQQAGAVRDALAVRRTFLESAPAEARAAGVLALAQAAADAGLDDLAAAYRTDLAPPSPSPSPSPSAAISEDRAPASRAGSFLAAQRRLARLSPGASVEPVLALLENAVSGHAAADDALALGEKLLAAGFPDGEARRVDLLRAANGTETDPTRRARLAERLAEALEQRRDRVGAVAVLEAALETLPAGMGASLRQRRARLLRDFGRPKDLAAALQGDIAALDDDERRDAFAERAVLLEAAGDPEGALEVRLAALIENPGDLPLLREARRRLDETGRWELSLRLASSAVAHLPAPAERLPLLRDIARLSEAAAHNLADAAKAWLEVARLDPTDVAAADAAERLLTALGDWDRCAALLAWQAARPPAAGSPSDGAAEVRRAGLLWRLAELRRTHLGQEEEATRLYRLLDDLPVSDGAPPVANQAVGARAALQPLPARAEPAIDLGVRSSVAGAAGRALAMRTLRARVAPTRTDLAAALLDRALYLADPLGRIPDAERDLARALDLDPRNVDLVVALERITERTGRFGELAEDLRRKAAAAEPPVAARLWYGIGRLHERQGEAAAALDAYRQSRALDGTLMGPVSALRRSARAAGDWAETARLLEIEQTLAPGPREAAEIAAELAYVLGDRLGQAARAVTLMESALSFFPDDIGKLDRLFEYTLAAGGARWEQAGQALETLLAHGVGADEAAARYFRVGEAAAAAGQPHRALIFYSRCYGRDSTYRPNLERLSALCFELEQWDNAWKATEGILERHRSALVRGALAELLLRSAMCDVHIAQRAAAAEELVRMLGDEARFVGDGGIRDVAESWGAMGPEPRLLVGLEGERRERVLRRTGEALAFAASDAATADVRRGALNLLGALAVVEGRWADALRFLGELCGDEGLPPPARCGFLLAAGDIHLREGNDVATARGLYQRAAALRPHDTRVVARQALITRLDRPAPDPLFMDDEEPTGVDLPLSPGD